MYPKGFLERGNFGTWDNNNNKVIVSNNKGIGFSNIYLTLSTCQVLVKHFT